VPHGYAKTARARIATLTVSGTAQRGLERVVKHCPGATTDSAPLCNAFKSVSAAPASRETGSEILTQVEELDSLKVARILLVDDSLPFRRFVREILDSRRGFQVIGEADNGLEAVRLATQLKPDLILLDIGLPQLNGIEAAKKISQAVPGTKILVITLNSAAEVVRAALSNGANGYVLKIDAASELWPAVEAVLHGEEFVSGSVVPPGTDSN